MSLWTLCAFTTTAVAEEVDYTSYIVNADLSTADAWNTEGTKGISGGVVKVGSGSSFDFSQTITIPAGHYKMTAKAVYRYGANEQEEYDAIQASANTHLAKLYAQTAAQTFEANVFNRYEGASETDYAAGSGSTTVNGLFVPNSSAAVQAWFEAGQYVNVLEFDVLEDGDVKIGIVKTESAPNGDYANIGAWTLTRTGDAQNTGEGEGEGEGEGDDTNTIDVDKTSAVNTDCAAWGGGWCATQFAPAVTTADGRTAQMAESYNSGSCTVTGTILSQTVTGLDNGTYTVEIYANAMWANGVDEANSTVDNAMDVAYVFAGENQVAIKAQRISSTSANGEYIIEGVEVTDGTLVIGLGKWKAGTNWHTIQIKALKLIVSDDAAVADAKAALLAVIEEAKAIDPATAELTAAIEVAQGIYDSSTDVEAIKAAVAPLQEAIKAANLANASKDNPVLTDFVVNGTFNTTTAPWVSTTNAQNKALASNQAGAFTGNFFENWNPNNYTGKIYQTINNIPNGVYELSICAFVETFGNGTNQYVYANDAKTYLTTGAPTAYKVIFAVTENTAEIGFEQSEAVNRWCGIDNVSLAYYGNCTIDEARFGSYIKQVTELRATATEYLTKVNEANKAALEAALAASESIEQTEEAYQTAVATLTAAINAAKANADVKVAIDNMYDLLASTNVYTQEAYETFKAAADAYLAKWDTNELTETVVNPYAITDWRATGITHDDLLISAWGIAPEMWDDMHVNTWSVEGGNDGTNFNVPFIEYWTGDANSLAATTKTATVAGLTPGAVCKVSAWVRVRAKNGQTDPTGITLSVGAEGTPVDVTEGVQVGTSQFFLAEYVAMGTADAEGNLTISFNIAADNNISWLSFKNVKYTVVPTGTNLDFSEGTPNDIHITTYDYDMEKNGTTYCQMQPVTSWNMGVANGNARAAGVFA